MRKALRRSVIPFVCVVGLAFGLYPTCVETIRTRKNVQTAPVTAKQTPADNKKEPKQIAPAADSQLQRDAEDDKSSRKGKKKHLTEVGVLIEKLKKAKSEEEKAEICLALIKIGKPAVPELIRALEYEKIRADIVHVLGLIQDPLAVDAIVDLLKDEDIEVQIWAAVALGMIGNSSATSGLVKALNDDTPQVRFFIVNALGEIGDRTATLPLVEKLSDITSMVRKETAKALGKIGDERALSELQRVAEEDRDVEVRFAAQDAIKAIESKNSEAQKN